MHVLLATDADWIVRDVTEALGGPDTSFTVCREGRVVPDVVAARTPDLAVLDLQVGSMGAMAITMALRLDESVGALPHVRVLMLLDREADVHLARRSGAEGWLIKPLDPLRLARAARTILDGGTVTEGLPAAEPVAPLEEDLDADDADDTPTSETDPSETSTGDSPEEQPVTAG